MKNTSCVQHHKTTVKHAAEHEPRATQNITINTDRRAHGQAGSRPPAPTTRQNMECECPNPDTKQKLEQDMSAVIRTPRSYTKQGTQTREHKARAHSKPHAHMTNGTWWECQGSVTKPRINYTVKKKSIKFTVKNQQLYLPEFHRKKYGSNILGFTVLT